MKSCKFCRTKPKTKCRFDVVKYWRLTFTYLVSDETAVEIWSIMQNKVLLYVRYLMSFHLGNLRPDRVRSELVLVTPRHARIPVTYPFYLLCSFQLIYEKTIAGFKVFSVLCLRSGCNSGVLAARPSLTLPTWTWDSSYPPHHTSYIIFHFIACRATLRCRANFSLPWRGFYIKAYNTKGKVSPLPTSHRWGQF